MIGAVTIAYDRALAAMLLFDKEGRTLSQCAGEADRARRRWGCIACRFLARTVEPDHCERAIAEDNDPTSGWAGVRAALLLLFGTFLPLTLAVWGGWTLAFRLAAALA